MLQLVVSLECMPRLPVSVTQCKGLIDVQELRQLIRMLLFSFALCSFLFGGLDGTERPFSSAAVMRFDLKTLAWTEVTCTTGTDAKDAAGPVVACGGVMVAHENSLWLFGGRCAYLTI
jgi:hypothetical protein